MSKAGDRNWWIPGIVGLLAGVLLVILLVRAFRSEYDTVEPVARYDLLPPDVQIESEGPIAKPSASLGLEEDRQTPTPTLTPKPTLSDEELLDDLTAFWVYRGYVGLGKQKTGRFTRRIPAERWQTVPFFLRQGEELEGVTVDKLDRLAAVVSLGEATLMMPLIQQRMPDFQQMEKPLIPTNEQIAAMQTAYEWNYGRGLRKMAESYTPRPGERMPPAKPPTEEENRLAMESYVGTYAPLFEAQNAQRTPLPGEVMPYPHQDPIDEQAAYKRYLERKGAEMPAPTPSVN